jgi:ribosome-associated translation inhibitor RaiA
MQVIFESRDPGGAELRDMAVRRLRFVMRRLTWLVPRAKVRLSDINGPRGGIDKRCQVELKTDVMGTVVITAMAGDWRTALDSALARASRVLTRSWRRNHAQPRRVHAGTERLLAEQSEPKPNPD